LSWADQLQQSIAAATPTKQPRKTLKLEPNHKFWRKHSGLLGRRIKKVRDWQIGELFGTGQGGMFPDPWKWWAEREVDARQMLQLFGGGTMPAESIIHVPHSRAIQYAARDADATLRSWVALRRKIKELQCVVRSGNHTPYTPNINT